MKKKFNSRVAAGRALLGLVLLAAAGCLVATGTLRAFVHPEAASKASPRTLTFAERVAYQRAIEEVYWRHRIWPKENARPKPSLDEVMPGAQLEKKVEDDLRNSEALEDSWGDPLGAEQLQPEMERMAQESKQPEVLGELFAALGNDPFVIAECLARPMLSERLIREPARNRGVAAFVSNAGTLGTRAPTSSANYTLPTISDGASGCADDTWTATSTTNAPPSRNQQTAVWTGSEMIVWGGISNDGFSNHFLDTGGRYNPSTNSWTATSTGNAPSGRYGHRAVWTGSEMIIWGGYNNVTPFQTGGRYNPATDSWTATSTINAPSARSSHTAIWTGTQMIVWGGFGIGIVELNTGGRYHPDTDSWTATSTTNMPSARLAHSAVWTGSEMIMWGGTAAAIDLNTGGRYNPGTDSWTATTTTNAPPGRKYYTAVWSGSEMIIWGGLKLGFQLNTGGRYNPVANSWVSTCVTNAPSVRYLHTAIWSGNEMIVWGGVGAGSANYLQTGGRYHPDTDRWTATSINNAPSGRYAHTAIWSGSEMIVWGGIDNPITPPGVNTGGRSCVQLAPMAQSAVSRKTHGAAGTFDLPLPLTCNPGIECRSGGATNDYTIVVTFLANVSVNGTPQAQVTSGTGTVGSGGISNGGMVNVNGNIVTIPLTNVANAQTISITLFRVSDGAADGNVVIPMGLLVGDTNGDGFVNSGDAQQTCNRSGQTTDGTNFRSDVDADGFINSGDTTIVRARSGTALP